MCCVWAYIMRYQWAYKTKEYKSPLSMRSIVNCISFFPKEWLFRCKYLMLKLLLYTTLTNTSKIWTWLSSYIRTWNDNNYDISIKSVRFGVQAAPRYLYLLTRADLLFFTWSLLLERRVILIATQWRRTNFFE